MKKYIHVNQSVIRHNKKYGNKLPACRIQIGTKAHYAREVIINGPSKMIYNPDNPLRCGAKLWIETESEIEFIDQMEYKEIAKIMDKTVTKSKRTKAK